MKKTFIAFFAAIMAFMIMFTAACASSCSEEKHEHNLTHISAVDATCEEAGHIEYWHCDGCDRDFYDAEGNNEVLSDDDLVVAALGHNWSTDWSKDEDTHWHACSRCGAKSDEATHVFENGVCVTCVYGTPIVNIAVTGVSLDQQTATVKVGGTLNLEAEIEPENATNKNVTWSSDNEAVATVSGGVVTAVKAGTAVITVTTEDGGKTATCTVTVSEDVISVTGVSLDKSSAALTVGGSVTLNATVTPSDATNRNVTWSSSDRSVATVSAGVVKAVGVGTATITVTTADGGKTASCTVTVSAPVVNVTGVTLDQESATVKVGGTLTLVATVEPSDATNQNVTWASNNETVATVDATGKVTAKAAGEATITVTTEDGSKTASCVVTVSSSAVSVTGVTLNKTSVSLEEGENETLVATVAPSDATNMNVTWKSDNTAVATVDATGKVTAVKAGTATITVTTADGNKTATCQVTVTAKVVAVTGVTLDKSTATLEIGDNLTLVATIAPSNATNKNVTWKSSNETVATVDATGKVVALKAGTATITVTTADGNKTATCTVTVNDETPSTIPVTGVSLNKATATLEIGDNLTLVATIAPSNATNRNVTWKSDNTAVATVDATGKVVALKAGDATITVTTEDGNKTATCEITVNDAATEPGQPVANELVFDYDYFIANCGAAEKVKTTQQVVVGIYTVASGVYYETTSSGLTGKVINTQGAANAFTFTVTGDTNAVYAVIKGASSDATVQKTVSLKRIDPASGTVLDTITISEDIASGSTITLNQTDLPAGTYVLDAVKSVRVAQLKVTEYTAPHVCTPLLVKDAQAATCTQEGNIAYYQCTDPDCGKYYSDAEGKNEITLEQTIVPATGHNPSEAWSQAADGSGHYHVCLNGCGVQLNFAAHDTNGAGGACSVCGYIEGHTHSAREVAIEGACTGSGLTKYYICDGCGTMFKDSDCTQVLTLNEINALSAHTLEHHAAVAATCTTQGNVEYWYCTACDKYYLNADATTETNEIAIVTNALGHNLGAWEDDSLTHYKTCTRCGEVDESTREDHSFDSNDTCTVCGYHVDTSILENIEASGAYNESMYAVLKTSSTDGITAQYSVANANTWYDVASQQIRVVDGQVRVDVIGISPDKYDLKILIANKDVVLEDINVEAYDRSGYAHFNYTNGIGAYDDDGTLKDGALVIYVTDENKNNISNDAYVYSDATKSLSSVSIDKYFEAGTDKSIGYFLNNRQYTDKETYGIKAACDDYGAVAIRIVGKVNAEVSGTMDSAISGLTAYNSTENGGSVKDNGRMARMVDAYNLTIEGIGEDSQIFGWGFHFIASNGQETKHGVHEGESFEVRNITFANYPEDAIGMEGQGDTISVPVQRCWVHDNVFMPGYAVSPAESDKAEGDGSCDFKRGYYYTFSYNYLEGCHKTNLIGSSDGVQQYYISMHHNMWYNCGSRIPLAREANIHFYNNYVKVDDINAAKEQGYSISYVISARSNSYLYVENNYFDGCKQLLRGGSTEGGTVKFYGNTLYACFDADITQATSRDEKVSGNCAYNGVNLNAFDTDTTGELFYYDNYYLTDSVTARLEVLEKAGNNGHYNGALDMNEMNPNQTVTVGSDGLTVDLSQVSGGSPKYVNGVLFNQGNVKAKGQIATFRLASEAQITVSGTQGSEYAKGSIVDSNGKLWVANIDPSATVVLPAGVYTITSGQKDKQFNITGISFADTSASSAARVEAAEKAIEAIPPTIALSDADKVAAARQAYDALTESEKADFNTALEDKLTSAEAKISELKIENVKALINAIGTVTKDSYAAINAARTAYNALSVAEQNEVGNYSTLTAAETEFEKFEVTNVKNLIDALPAISEIDKTDQAAVQQAYDKYEDAYDAYRLLDEEQAAQVGGELYDKVTQGMAYLKDVLAVYKFKVALAETSVDAGTADIGAIVTAYNKLDAGVVAQILTAEEKSKYETLKATYDKYAKQAVSVSFTSSAGNYIDNNSKFAYSGNTRTNSAETVTVDGVTYTTSLKMETSTSITFTTEASMNIKIYCLSSQSGNKIKIDGQSYTIQSDGTVSASGALAAGAHTISKDSTNVYVFLIVLSPAA